MALRVTEAIQVHGGYGFTEEFLVSRFYRSARYGTLGGGTTETLKDLIGREASSGCTRWMGFWGWGRFDRNKLVSVTSVIAPKWPAIFST